MYYPVWVRFLKINHSFKNNILGEKFSTWLSEMSTGFSVQ